jgi:hypothetical protein
MKIQDQERLENLVAGDRLLTSVANPSSAIFSRLVRLFLMAVVATVCAAGARAQNTQVTLSGTITSAGTVPGIAVGDKYNMAVYYNPAQAPSSVIGSGEAYYSSYTLSAIVNDTHGNQRFSTSAGELLYVSSLSGSNDFYSTPCCGSTGAGFVLEDNIGIAFTTDALPTTLKLADFNNNYVSFGSNATGNITEIRVVNTAGVMPLFISAGAPDPNGKVPAVNAVTGSGVNNLDISAPLATLVNGGSYVYTIALQDVNFTGTCQASFTLTQVQYNKTVTLDSGKVSTFACGPGNWWGWAFSGKTIPNSPGPATLTGTVTYGSQKATTVTTLVLQ